LCQSIATMTLPIDSPEPAHRAFSYASYRRFWFAVLANTFATQIMSVAIAWQVYDMTGNPLYLGLIGLVQFLPALILVLITGWTADRFSRRAILALALGVEAISAATLLWFALTGFAGVGPIFVVLLALGISRAFMRPAEASLAPNLVPPIALSNAITLNATAWQSANIIGPMAGGLLYGISARFAFGSAIVLVLLALALILSIAKPDQLRAAQTSSARAILGGFKYIWHQKVVLGAISLDLFAVFLGGAVALLPVYARDILEVGPWGLGLLRGAPGVGAILMALAMTRFPVADHAGKILLGFVAAFGFFTVIFGFSTSVWVAVPALFLMGGADMVSVVVRETMLQLWTPDALRGRVNAVNAVFVGASNELGEFRAGVMAFWIGAVGAVTLGGAATMAVSAGWAFLFPQMRDIRKLNKAQHEDEEKSL
jgi:MFS family permease